jgi:hypothetical protein
MCLPVRRVGARLPDRSSRRACHCPQVAVSGPSAYVCFRPEADTRFSRVARSAPERGQAHEFHLPKRMHGWHELVGEVGERRKCWKRVSSAEARVGPRKVMCWVSHQKPPNALRHISGIRVSPRSKRMIVRTLAPPQTANCRWVQPSRDRNSRNSSAVIGSGDIMTRCGTRTGWSIDRVINDSSE